MNFNECNSLDRATRNNTLRLLPWWQDKRRRGTSPSMHTRPPMQRRVWKKKEREKEKKLKKTRGKRRPTLRMLFRRRGMLGFDYLDFQILSDRSVQIHDHWYCCCSVDKMTHSSSNGCLVTVQILLCSGRLVPSCILKVY